MPSGACLCGNLKVEYEGDPAVRALCHCIDCRKVSGSAFSVNCVVPDGQFKHSGPTKEYIKDADSGTPITSYFCPDCGTTCFRKTDTFKGLTIVKAGILDGDGLEQAKPDVEFYCVRRAAWVPKAGADEKEYM